MPHRQRLEFIARHFLDLQTIRFAPVAAAMLLAPLAAYRMPQVSRGVAWESLSGFLLLVAAFFWWTTAAIRRRYDSVRLSRKEALRMRRHPVILALYTVLALVLVWFHFFASHTYQGDVYISFTILIIMLQTILDSTNPPSRRMAWAIGLIILFTAGLLFRRVDGAAIAIAGAIWLLVGLFDFLLLRRTIALLSAFRATGTTEALMHRA